jgi:hypothetical protein
MNPGKVIGLALASACLAASAAPAGEMDDATFALPQDLAISAAAFEGYMHAAAAIDSGFSNGESVARSLRAASSYQPVQLEEGMIAYGAMAALQDARFVAGVEAAAGRGSSRAAFADALLEDPFIATRIQGAYSAARRIEAAFEAEAAPLYSAGTQVKAAAYSVQRHAWSKAMVADPSRRLAEVKTLSASRAVPSDEQVQATLRSLVAMSPGPIAGEGPGYTAVEARALALAAESVLGRAGNGERERLTPLLSEADNAECLKMAKLNLYQCMAVAGPQYEDIFCMGEHAMRETAQCVERAAHHRSPVPVSDYAASRDEATAIPLTSRRDPGGRPYRGY